MKTFLGTLSFSVYVVTFACLCFGAVEEACTPAETKMVVRTVVDLALAECVALHTEIEDVDALAAACDAGQAAKPLIDQLLSARQKGMRRGACLNPGLGQDGGD